MNDDFPSQPAAPQRGAWHMAWLVAMVAVPAVLTLLLGEMPGSAYLAFAAMAAPAALSGVIREDRSLLVVWAAAAALAVTAGGGVTGPTAPWGLMLFAAAVVLRRGQEEAIILALLVLGSAILIERSAITPEPPEGWMRTLVMAAVLGTTGWALVGTLGRGGARRSGPAPVAPAPAPQDPEETPEALKRRLDEALADKAEAEAANAAKSRFLASMSHELRTPLNAIMGFADIMRNRLFGPMPDRYAEYSQLIHESGQHLLELINDVLDVSKIEADKFQLSREVFDAKEAVGSVLKLMRPQAEDAGVDLRAVLPEGPLTVEADKRALKQIALNLLSNALKFTPRGGSVTVSLMEADDQMELMVADTGVGVAPEDLERLGRPYEQAGGVESRARGTGLGLSLVRGFAGLHGGEMGIESVLGEGTAVTVRMPVLAPQAAPDAQTRKVIPFAQR